MTATEIEVLVRFDLAALLRRIGCGCAALSDGARCLSCELATLDATG